MPTLKESGEAWIAAGQREYGQMLVDAADEIERLNAEIAEAKGQIEWLDKSNSLLRSQVDNRATSSVK